MSNSSVSCEHVGSFRGILSTVTMVHLWCLLVTVLSVTNSFALTYFGSRNHFGCSYGYFKCDDGQCIHPYWPCDGIKNCKDGSDEDRSYCDYRSCPDSEDWFRCDSGQCIHRHLTCDIHTHCVDKSDEDPKRCHTNEGCKIGWFTCNDGQCLHPYSPCDFVDDCSEGEDENTYMCGTRSCDENFFQCNSGQCIDINLRCNSDENCADGSDEEEEMCRYYDCGDRFQCRSGHCLDNFKKCDFKPHCKDGSDEDPTLCQDEYCAQPHFACPNSTTCIHPYWACNGEANCPGGADEDPALCRKRSCPDSSWFKCDNGQCIHGNLACNKEVDCNDGSDENYCSPGMTRPPTTTESENSHSHASTTPTEGPTMELTTKEQTSETDHVITDNITPTHSYETTLVPTVMSVATDKPNATIIPQNATGKELAESKNEKISIVQNEEETNIYEISWIVGIIVIVSVGIIFVLWRYHTQKKNVSMTYRNLIFKSTTEDAELDGGREFTNICNNGVGIDLGREYLTQAGQHENVYETLEH